MFLKSFWHSQKLLVIAMAGLWFAPLLPLIAENADVVKEAEALFIEGSVDASIDLLETLDLEANPRALVMLASIYCNTEDWEKLKTLIKDIQAFPYLIDLSYYFKGRIALAKNRLGSARRAFEQAAKERPSNTQFIQGHIYFYQAVCFNKLNQIDQAAEAYEKALENNFFAESLEEIIQLSQFHARFGEAQTTISYLNSYPKSLLKEDAQVGALLGRAYLKKAMNFMAIRSFTESLTLDPEQVSILALRADAYRLTKNYKASLIDIQAAIALAPELKELNYILGLVYFEMGKLKSAHSAFQKIGPLLYNNSDFLILSAQLAFTVNAIPFSKQALQRYFQLRSDTRLINAYYLAYCLNEQSQTDTLRKPQSLDWILFENYMNGNNSADFILAKTTSASLTFFMAQVAKRNKDSQEEKRLLEITLERALNNSPEYLCAQWQLKALEN